MPELPDLVDINSFIQRANGNYTRYFTPEMNLLIRQMIDMLGLDHTDEKMRKQIWNDRTEAKIASHLLLYAIRNGYIDYSKVWYKWLKNKINEFNYRYTRKHLIYKDNIDTYKKLFRLYILIITETNVLKAVDKGRELDYFIAAQYSSRYSSMHGLLTKFTVNLFLFPISITNYEDFRRKSLPCTLLHPPPRFLYYAMESQEVKRRIRNLPDAQFAPYLDIALPIITLKLPCLQKRKKEWLCNYIRSLEFLIVREQLLNRKHNRFLLSIEHLRAYKEVKGRCP